MTPHAQFNRRQMAAGLFGMLSIPPSFAHEAPGQISPPRALPTMPLLLEDGRDTDLRQLLLGRVTAVQFVLTQCSAICPLLGAIFMQTQQQLASEKQSPVQFLSISLDPLDTPALMKRWLQQQGAGAAWRGAVPRADQGAALEALRKLGSGQAERDQHSAQIMLVNRQAQMVFRTAELPQATMLSRALLSLSQAA